MHYKQREKFFIIDDQSGSVEMGMLQHMHPALVLMIAYTNLWCHSNGIKPVWTSWMRTPEQNRALGASDVHIYRGADLSDKKEHGWNSSKIVHFERDFRSMFQNVGAFTHTPKGMLKRQPIIRHDSGHGSHFHLQVAPNADIDGLRSMRPQGIREERAKRAQRNKDRREQDKNS